jgi:hypothetical protein
MLTAGPRQVHHDPIDQRGRQPQFCEPGRWGKDDSSPHPPLRGRQGVLFQVRKMERRPFARGPHIRIRCHRFSIINVIVQTGRVFQFPDAPKPLLLCPVWGKIFEHSEHEKERDYP